jgi:hypothetical protein
MTTFQRIPLQQLEVNPANDRHGDVGSEASAIEWLLVNKTDKMRDLLDDIHERQGIVDEPLVMKIAGEDKYVVYDGNRRVTCLKLLHGLAPTDIQNPLAKKVEILRAKPFPANQSIECRVEDDLDHVNNILELRHIPGNSGAGQLKWDGHEKENFLERTGKSQKINLAREVNNLLIRAGYLSADDRIPLSNFNRLFSSKEIRRRAGIDIDDNKLQLVNNEQTAYSALTRIAKDMMAGRKTLDDVWDNSKKNLYLDELENEGLLPSAKNRLQSPVTVTQPPVAQPATIRPVQGPHLHNHLLPTDMQAPVQNEFFSSKFCILFYELQNTLRFNQHLISMAIALRAFIEILTAAYLRKHGLNDKAGLATRIQTAFAHMHTASALPETTRAFVVKLSDDKEYFSINTLHKAIHNDFQISDQDLRAFVNNLDAYIRRGIEDINE